MCFVLSHQSTFYSLQDDFKNAVYSKLPTRLTYFTSRCVLR